MSKMEIPEAPLFLRFSWPELKVQAVLSFCALLALASLGSTVNADTRLEISTGIRLENIRVEAGRVGADAQIKLIIVNEGQIAMHLVRVTSAVSGGSKIETEISPQNSMPIEMLTIPANETLNLETFHQRIFLSRLKRDLVAGEDLAIRFHFLEGELNAFAHVH